MEDSKTLTSYMIRFILRRTIITPKKWGSLIKELGERFYLSFLPSGNIVVLGDYIIGVLCYDLCRRVRTDEVKYEYASETREITWGNEEIIDIKTRTEGDRLIITYVVAFMDIGGRVAVTIDTERKGEAISALKELNTFLRICKRHRIETVFDLLRPM